jgi:hypothetical protein
MLRVAPARILLVKDTVEPTRTIDRSEIAEPMDIMSYTEEENLNTLCLRTDIELPRCKKFAIEIDFPTLMTERTDTLDPTCDAVAMETPALPFRLPVILRPLPNLEKPRNDRVDPNFRKSRMLTREPSLTWARTDTELPKATEPMTDTLRHDPNRIVPTIDAQLPQRDMPRMDIEDPSTRKLRMEVTPHADPRPLTDTEDPVDKQPRTERTAPVLRAFPVTESPLPQRNMLRNEQELAQLKKSKILTTPVLERDLTETDEPN